MASQEFRDEFESQTGGPWSRILSLGRSKFAEDVEFREFEGWTWMQIGDSKAATAAFEGVEEGFAAEVQDDPFFIMGFAIAHWFAQEQDQAVATFLRLVKSNKAWLKVETITQRNLSESEMKALIDVQKEALRRDPSISPGK